MGSHTQEHLPLARGFDSHVGFLSGMEDYVSHQTGPFYDWTSDGQIDTSAAGTHTEEICRDQLDQILDAHPIDGDPLFIFLSLQTPHCPLGQVPRRFVDMYENRFHDHSTDTVPGPHGPTGMPLPTARVLHAALVSYMDETVARAVGAFERNGLWNQTLMVFASDNGGCATALSPGCQGGSSNWPLRWW